MIDRQAAERWIQGYLAAARTDDPELIKALFAQDALYFDGPFAEAWHGHDEIIKNWTEQSDKPYEVEVDYRVVAVESSTAVAEVEYRYVAPEAQTYRNMWLIELDEAGRARLFKDYWIEDPAAKQTD